jgi:hypothetical protein
MKGSTITEIISRAIESDGSWLGLTVSDLRMIQMSAYQQIQCIRTIGRTIESAEND